MGIENKIEHNIGLAQFTTFKIGGNAKFFAQAEGKEDLAGLIGWAKENKERVYVLAGGSNLLVNDKGVDGLVVKYIDESIIVRGEEIECGAGANLPKVLNLSAESGLEGLAWAFGIPGTIGGAVRGNVGAFGQDISKVVKSVEAYDTEQSDWRTFNQDECNFEYKESVFKENPNLIITKVVFQLSKGDSGKIRQEMADFIKYRTNSQPKEPSAGCIFKNLRLSDIEMANPELIRIIRESGAGRGDKIGAGWFIDQSELKGKIIGGAKVSEKHANFIVNTGNATAENVAMLISLIKQKVRQKFNIELQEEIQYFGF